MKEIKDEKFDVLTIEELNLVLGGGDHGNEEGDEDITDPTI